MSGTAAKSVGVDLQHRRPAASADERLPAPARPPRARSGAWRANAARIAARREAEHPGVPDVACPTARYSCAVASGGFSTKRRGRDATARRRDARCAALDVAEAGLGVRRRDAEGRRACRARASATARRDRRGERRLVADQVVGRQHQHHGVGRRSAPRACSAASATAGAVLRPNGSSRNARAVGAAVVEQPRRRPACAK